MSRDLRGFADETAARPDVEERVLARVLADAPEVRRCGALIREIPGGIPGAEERVLARLRGTLLRDEPRWRPMLVPLLYLAAATAAAAATYLVAPRISDAEPEGERAPSSSAVAASLDGRGELGGITGLDLAYQGVGELSGTAAQPVIRWSRGTLRLEVDPARDMELTVLTDEGTVRVLGTIVTVHRDAMGTRVEVERGLVTLACAAGGSSQLTEGAIGVCLPTTAAGMLGRGRAQLRGGAAAAEVLESVAIGQQLAEPGDLDWRELQALRIQALLGERQYEAACRAARDYPANPEDPRAAELEAILASRWCTPEPED